MEGYLTWNGIEIVNATRTVTYLNNGLGPPGLTSPGVGCTCSALAGSYVSPSADPAPWYDSSKPESAQFLGLVPAVMNLVPSLARTTGPSGVYGSTMGRLALAGNVVQCQAWMLSSTAEGQEYGERWLLSALRSQTPQGCAGCDLGTAVILPACVETGGFRTLYRCGLVDYTPAAAGDAPFWYWRNVAFQVRSELPWMFLAPVTVINNSTATGAGAAVTTGTWPGETAMRFTITTGAGGNVGPTTFTGVRNSGNGSNYAALTVGVLPPLTTFTVDAATRDVSLIDQTGTQIGGIDMLTLTAPFSWPEMVAGSTMTWSFAITARNAGTTVKIERIDREV